jgi:hypothetical protein
MKKTHQVYEIKIKDIAKANDITSNSKVLSCRGKNTINGKSKSFFMIYAAPTLLIEGISNV